MAFFIFWLECFCCIATQCLATPFNQRPPLGTKERSKMGELRVVWVEDIEILHQQQTKYETPSHLELLVFERAYFIWHSSFIEFQTVEFEHVSSSTVAWTFWVLAQVMRVFQAFSSSSLAEFEFWGLKLVGFLSFE